MEYFLAKERWWHEFDNRKIYEKTLNLENNFLSLEEEVFFQKLITFSKKNSPLLKNILFSRDQANA